MMKTAIVIGSGPSGSTAALTLIERGWSVQMIDIGATPDRDAAERKARAASPVGLTDQDFNFLADKLFSGAVPLKSSWGSFYPYAVKDPVVNADLKLGALMSKGLGGFSSVWGGALLRLANQEYRRWPLAVGALDQHYDAVERLIRPLMTKDALWDNYPFCVEACWSAQGSTQAQSILKSLENASANMDGWSTLSGASRLAVRNNCNGCGYCMFGCPQDSIFNSESIVANLRTNERFSYLPGFEAIELQESSDSASVVARRQEDSALCRFSADKVIVAAGAVATPVLLLRSHPALGELLVRDSQYFLLPLLWLRKAPSRVQQGRALSEIFIELDDLSVSEHRIHTQLYTYTRLYREKITRINRFAAAPLLAHLADMAARHLMLAQSYLHSDDSGAIAVSLKGPGRTPFIEDRPNTRTSMVLRRLRKRLKLVLSRSGLFPLAFLAEQAEIGRSYHLGASVPMARTLERANESDMLGRPFGWSSIHIVDSSVLPTIPSTAPTLTIMANARRIAAEVSSF